MSFDKRGQMTMFIVIAILIISGIALLIFFNKGTPLIGSHQEINKKEFLESCVEEEVKNTLEIIGLQGGYFSESKIMTKSYSSGSTYGQKNIAVLCYNKNYFDPCINQDPMLIQHLNDEIKKGISKTVKDCFDALTLSLENQGFEVQTKYNGFDVQLLPEKLKLDIKGEITISQTGSTTKEKDFEILFRTRLYDIAIVAQNIINQEASTCSFDHSGFMLYFKEFSIDKIRTSDSFDIFAVKSKDSYEIFNFALRGCVIPPGV